MEYTEDYYTLLIFYQIGDPVVPVKQYTYFPTIIIWINITYLRKSSQYLYFIVYLFDDLFGNSFIILRDLVMYIFKP